MYYISFSCVWLGTLACTLAGSCLLLCVLHYIFFHFLNKKKNEFLSLLREKENVGIIIAHPDDEIMFFFPTIKLLFDKKKKAEIFLLSLSNGDYYGQGRIREKELYHVWSYIGGLKNNCKVINDPNIRDGWNFWNEKCLVDVIADYCTRNNIRKVLTFDEYGVSGHPNHISVHNSLRLLSKEKGIKVLTLNSTHLIIKYLGLFSLPFLLQTKFLTFQFNPVLLLKLMSIYRSQFVFYRILFCICSQYAYFNSFDLLN
ncbi:N-acetylglucosaminylphosphatidylinositol deacetylase [Plasmodium gonderi]|uniref:N-acetylglucosaminylphosphatidylinositol deacetylase n=1 Tax=Plasmodium gonderi TaxID=77519 RepID=A0A1Y1JN12_PLAGO|nr:N-acetylglucosaminylphosphatidylinositol deacetylase [Plasmodium gonderi]GAW81783.1 N-acetylglucosaminylphosphatidylinositol deacetylase [Plasmodium gonderi]